MKNQNYTYDELQQRIGSLKESCEKHETLILKQVSELHAIAKDPGHYIAEVASDLAGKKDFKANLLKIGLSIGTDYLYRRLSRRGSGSSGHSASNEAPEREQEKNQEGSTENSITGFLTDLLLNLSRKSV
jgi:hypothetical protein